MIMIFSNIDYVDIYSCNKNTFTHATIIGCISRILVIPKIFLMALALTGNLVMMQLHGTIQMDFNSLCSVGFKVVRCSVKP